jgi:AraC-like DNA-binding protein
MAVQKEHRFLAEGVQLAFNLADPIEQVGTASESLTPHHSNIYGPMTTPIRVRTLGRMEVLGVCFRPGRAYPFISYPAGELTNRCIRTDDILDSEALQIVERILRDCHMTDERIKILDLHFLHRLEKDVSNDFSTAAAADRIETNRGRVKIYSLAKSVGWSSRQLERRFKERVGMSPKQLCRNVRFKSAFQHLASSRRDPFASTAMDCGYYDQSHMIKDFKHYTGTSPAAFFRKPQAMEGLFTGNF